MVISHTHADKVAQANFLSTAVIPYTLIQEAPKHLFSSFKGSLSDPQYTMESWQTADALKYTMTTT